MMSVKVVMDVLGVTKQVMFINAGKCIVVSEKTVGRLGNQENFLLSRRVRTCFLWFKTS